MKSGSLEFLAIIATKDDGPADVCHVGNGPTSPANACAIAALHNHAAALLAVAEAARELLAVLPQYSEGMTVHPAADPRPPTEALRAALARVEGA